MPDQEALVSMRAMAEKEFPDRNLDVLRQRVASMRTDGPRMDVLMAIIEQNLVGDGAGSVTLALDEAGDWSAVIDPSDAVDSALGYGATLTEALDDAVRNTGWVSRLRVAAQEDDGETD